MQGVSKIEENRHKHGQQCGDCWGRVWGDKWCGRDVTWGNEHTVLGTDYVLWNCVPDTCMILLTSVAPIN